MFTVTPSTSSNDKGLAFLSAGTGNYISARLLYLMGQFPDAGVMAHESIEKIMKAILYQLKPARRDLSNEHNLQRIKAKVEKELRCNLSNYNVVLDYFETCYIYRYPDNTKPPGFNSGTNYIKLLDAIFIELHNYCIDLISSDNVKYKSGLYEKCTEFYLDRHDNKLQILLDDNDSMELATIEAAKTFWHNLGYYKTNDEGHTHIPGAGVVVEHKIKGS